MACGGLKPKNVNVGKRARLCVPSEVGSNDGAHEIVFGAEVVVDIAQWHFSERGNIGQAGRREALAIKCELGGLDQAPALLARDGLGSCHAVPSHVSKLPNLLTHSPPV